MKRKLILLMVLLTSVGSALAQTGKITAVLVDSATRAGLPGAVVELVSVKNSAAKHYATSGYGGKIETNALAYGDYKMTITFLGYSDVKRDITLKTPVLKLDTIYIHEAATAIDKVTKAAQAIRASAKGDTVSYNADAFKVSSDATVDGLLSKMPGIKVVNGEVEAQGETVQKIFVDGKEFFNNDVSTAIKSLPAEVVDKIEVYNKKSDQAEFTGFDDGEDVKAINIVTRRDKRKGAFGQLYAGVGYGPNDAKGDRFKYMAGGTVNIFSNNHRVTLLGLYNNINQQNFSFEDILGAIGGGGSFGGGGRGFGGGMRSFMVRPESGVARTGSFGLNYNGQWGKKIEASGSYFYGNTRTENATTMFRQYFASADSMRYTTEGGSLTKNYNNRVNLRLKYDINSSNSLMFRGGASFQTYMGNSNTVGLYDQDPVHNWSSSYRGGYRLNGNLLYRVKLWKPGRTLTVNFGGNYSSNENPFDINNYTGKKNNLSGSLVTQNSMSLGGIDFMKGDSLIQGIRNESLSYRMDGSLTYTEPLSKSSQLSLEYRVSYNYSDGDKKSFLWEKELNAFNPDYNEQLSNINNSGYLVQRVGPGYRFSKNKSNLTTAVYYQNSLQTRDQELPVLPLPHLSARFSDVTYMAMGNIYFNKENNLRMDAYSYTSNPSITQLQSIPDLTNTKNVSAGNPDLQPSYSHNFRAHYMHSNLIKGRTFMMMLGGEVQSNYIADSTVMLSGTGQQFEIADGVYLDPNGQYTKPVNLNGYWRLFTGVNYGLPLNFIKCNFNINAGINFSESPSIINGQENTLRNFGYNAGAVLGSNISENVDFTLMWNGQYNVANNSILNTGNSKYFYHAATANMKFTFWKGFTFTANASYSQYKGVTEDYNQSYIICNAYLGKKVFKNRRGEVKVGVNDLLNQNKGFSHSVTNLYWQNSTNRVIGRYYSLQFVYNLRHFGKKGSQNINDYQTMPANFGRGGMRPGMMPPMRR